VRDPATLGVVGLDEVKAHLNISTDTLDEELRAFMDVATDACERYAGSVLGRRTITAEAHDGGTNAVFLNAGPILSVTTVNESGVATTDYTQPTGTQALLKTAAFYYGTYVNWNMGVNNVVVTYVAGYSEPPPIARQAVLELVRHLWQTQRGSMSGRNALSGDEYAAGSGWSLPNRCKELLELLKRPVVLG
jgi:uncharacterized phiE125 gp8 family phage protein